MKALLSCFHRALPVIALIVYSSLSLSAQVSTRYLSEEAHLHNFLPWLFKEAPETILLKIPDVDAELAKDAEADAAKRYGVNVSTSLTREDGKLFDFGSYAIWKLPIKAEGAESISLFLTGLRLPAGSQLVVYSRETAMLHGPIQGHDLSAGTYFTDLIVGETAIIEVVLPADAVDDFEISLSSIVYGIVSQLHLLPSTTNVKTVVVSQKGGR